MKRDKAQIDRPLIARIIKREIVRNRDIRTVQGLATVSGVSRSTINDVLAAKPHTQSSTLSRLEPALGLPFDALPTAGAHDLAGLVELGVSAELVAWIRNELAKSDGNVDKAI